MSKFLVVVLSALLVACGSGDPHVGRFVNQDYGLDYTVTKVSDGKYVLNGQYLGEDAVNIEMVKVDASKIESFYGKGSSEKTIALNEPSNKSGVHIGKFDLSKMDENDRYIQKIAANHKDWDGYFVNILLAVIPVDRK